MKPIQLEKPTHAADIVWDYFYLRFYPSRADEGRVSRIVAATERLRSSIQYVCESQPQPLQLHHAKRVRRAVREIFGHIHKMQDIPELHIAPLLAQLEVMSDIVVQELQALPGVMIQ